MKQLHARLRKDQSGLVSFLVVMIVLGIVTLLVLAYAQIARREQRQALDRQLNSQALFAAESGVNDAMKKLESNDSLLDTDYTECDDFTKAASLNPQVGENSSYSCLLVDPTPTQLRYDGIGSGQSQIVPILPKGGGSAQNIYFSWTQSGDISGGLEKAGCPASGSISGNGRPFQATWPDNCDYAVLRLELVPFSSGGNSRDNLIQNRGIFYVMPVSDAVPDDTTRLQSLNSGTGNGQGLKTYGYCADTGLTKSCSIGIRSSGFRGYVRVTPLYVATALSVIASNSSGEIEFTGAQVDIDVTGRATDILKRIRVFRSLDGSGNPLPGYAIQSEKTQCKQFEVNSGTISFDTSIPECDPTN